MHVRGQFFEFLNRSVGFGEIKVVFFGCSLQGFILETFQVVCFAVWRQERVLKSFQVGFSDSLKQLFALQTFQMISIAFTITGIRFRPLWSDFFSILILEVTLVK